MPAERILEKKFSNFCERNGLYISCDMSVWYPVLREDLLSVGGVVGGFPRWKMHDVASGYASLIAVLPQLKGFLIIISQMNITSAFTSEQLLNDMGLT